MSNSFLKKDFINLFLEREERKEKERERNINVWLALMCPLLGTWPEIQACAPAGNWTSDPLVCRPGTQSTEPHQPGPMSSLQTTSAYACRVSTVVHMAHHIFVGYCLSGAWATAGPDTHLQKWIECSGDFPGSGCSLFEFPSVWVAA